MLQHLDFTSPSLRSWRGVQSESYGASIPQAEEVKAVGGCHPVAASLLGHLDTRLGRASYKHYKEVSCFL